MLQEGRKEGRREEVLQEGRNQGLDGLPSGEESLPPVGVKGRGSLVRGWSGEGAGHVSGRVESREKRWNRALVSGE